MGEKWNKPPQRKTDGAPNTLDESPQLPGALLSCLS
jgi:hypothetical protein